jgi:hypothetical protein
MAMHQGVRGICITNQKHAGAHHLLRAEDERNGPCYNQGDAENLMGCRQVVSRLKYSLVEWLVQKSNDGPRGERELAPEPSWRLF